MSDKNKKESWETLERGYYTKDQLHIIKSIMASPFFNLHFDNYCDHQREQVTWDLNVFEINDEVVIIGNGRNYSKKNLNTDNGLIQFGHTDTFKVTSKITGDFVPLKYFFDPKLKFKLSKYKYVTVKALVNGFYLVHLNSCKTCEVRQNGKCKGSRSSKDCKKSILKYLEDLYEF